VGAGSTVAELKMMVDTLQKEVEALQSRLQKQQVRACCWAAGCVRLIVLGAVEACNGGLWSAELERAWGCRGC